MCLQWQRIISLRLNLILLPTSKVIWMYSHFVLIMCVHVFLVGVTAGNPSLRVYVFMSGPAEMEKHTHR